MRVLLLSAALGVLASLVIPALATGQADTTWQVEEIEFQAPDGVELTGLLLIPDGVGPFPGAVIIQGSGDSDRTNLWARTVAQTLARAGIATLLPDKRGSGESGGEWLSASFEVLARDALATVERVQANPKIGYVGLVGLSQGGHIAPLAAAIADVAWVVDVSGAAVTVAEQIRHEIANTAREAGLSPEAVEAVVEIQRLAEGYVEAGEWQPYAQAIESAEGKPWQEIAEGFPDSPQSPIWDWARLNGTYDPIPYWKDVDVPILVAYGEEDEDDNVPVAESVHRLEAALAGHDDATIRVFAGAGHALWAADATQEDLRLNAEFVELLTEWILDRSDQK
ncbi:MAG: alpha/beta hydrolase family protein [Gemmatimonadota bacterium]